jgi:hypothetical protein
LTCHLLKAHCQRNQLDVITFSYARTFAARAMFALHRVECPVGLEFHDVGLVNQSYTLAPNRQRSLNYYSGTHLNTRIIDPCMHSLATQGIQFFSNACSR